MIQRLKRRVASSATRTRRTFPARLRRLMRRGRPEPPIGPPIFIVGCGHSGTTLLLAILSVHSRLHSLPYETSCATKDDAEMDWFVRRFNEETAAAGKARWIEKTPLHIYELPRLLARFPDARVILMLRDGRDVAASLRARTGDLEDGIRRWLDDNAAGEPFHDHPATFVVKYEDLIATRDQTLRALIEFLEEPFEPTLLTHEAGDFRFYGIFSQAHRVAAEIDELDAPPPSVSGADHRLHRSWQARQPVFDGRGRWQRELDDQELEMVMRLAGAKLAQYGYVADSPA